MDKILVCGTSAPGSIPGGSTKIEIKTLTLAWILFLESK
jgi:hypothetical protein